MYIKEYAVFSYLRELFQRTFACFFQVCRDRETSSLNVCENLVDKLSWHTFFKLIAIANPSSSLQSIRTEDSQQFRLKETNDIF